MFGAALSEKTAGWLASWSDGLITINHPDEKLEKLTTTYRSGNPNGELTIKVQLSYAKDLKTAEILAWENWRNNILGGDSQAMLSHPKLFDEAARFVRVEDMRDHVLLVDRPEVLISALKKYKAMGFTRITLHNVNRDQVGFLELMGSDVLPSFKQV